MMVLNVGEHCEHKFANRHEMINAAEVTLNISALHTYPHPLTHSSLVLVTTLTLTCPVWSFLCDYRIKHITNPNDKAFLFVSGTPFLAYCGVRGGGRGYEGVGKRVLVFMVAGTSFQRDEYHQQSQVRSAHCWRIKPQWAGIPLEWVGLAQRNSPVFTEHLHVISSSLSWWTNKIMEVLWNTEMKSTHPETAPTSAEHNSPSAQQQLSLWNHHPLSLPFTPKPTE